jgi:hypothetical protein
VVLSGAAAVSARKAANGCRAMSIGDEGKELLPSQRTQKHIHRRQLMGTIEKKALRTVPGNVRCRGRSTQAAS